MIYLILLLKCFAKVAENEISDKLLETWFTLMASHRVGHDQLTNFFLPLMKI